MDLEFNLLTIINKKKMKYSLYLPYFHIIYSHNNTIAQRERINPKTNLKIQSNLKIEKSRTNSRNQYQSNLKFQLHFSNDYSNSNSVFLGKYQTFTNC